MAATGSPGARRGRQRKGLAMRKTPAALALLTLLLAAGLAACQPAPPAPAAQRPVSTPRAAPPPADPEVDRLGLDLGIAMITVECEDQAIRRQALRTRDAVLERTRLLSAQDRTRGEEVWAEAEAVMARQARRPGQAECERALPALREAEQTARGRR
jgi:hypothetical protein